MNKYKLDHIHLICPDIEATKNWYCDILDGKVTFEAILEGNKVYYLKLTDFVIILIEQLPGEKPLPASLETRQGLDHFGLEVEDMDEAVKEFTDKGVRFLVEPTQIRHGLCIAYIEAPDKVRIELAERK